MPDRPHEAIKAAFVAALELPEEGRAAYLEQALANPDDRAEVTRLLRWYREHYLSVPAVEIFYEQSAGDIDNGQHPEADEKSTGRRIGDYEIIRELGRGGMGIVYLARRADDLYKEHVGHQSRAGRRRRP